MRPAGDFFFIQLSNTRVSGDDISINDNLTKSGIYMSIHTGTSNFFICMYYNLFLIKKEYYFYIFPFFACKSRLLLLQ